MKQLGILGYGSFGRFATAKLAGSFSVLVHDPSTSVPEDLESSLDQLCGCDYLMLAIPLAAYQAALNQIKKSLAAKTVIIEISSVKTKPIRLIKELLPGQPFLGLHPLFGPQSASASLSGHTVVLCESNLPQARLDKFKDFCSALELKLVELSSAEHDRQMAVVQGLTFFVARALNRFGISEMQFKTGSFQKLLDLAELDRNHSDDLINTILLGNRYALEVRQDFLRSIVELDQQIMAPKP